jgi:hypothetical protein
MSRREGDGEEGKGEGERGGEKKRIMKEEGEGLEKVLQCFTMGCVWADLVESSQQFISSNTSIFCNRWWPYHYSKHKFILIFWNPNFKLLFP